MIRGDRMRLWGIRDELSADLAPEPPEQLTFNDMALPIARKAKARARRG
jgi:hypothetical protein